MNLSVSRRNTEVRLTHHWRKPDSNSRSHLRNKGRLEGHGAAYQREAEPILKGTGSSNPVSSSGESVSPVHSDAAREKSRAFAGLYA